MQEPTQPQYQAKVESLTIIDKIRNYSSSTMRANPWLNWTRIKLIHIYEILKNQEIYKEISNTTELNIGNQVIGAYINSEGEVEDIFIGDVITVNPLAIRQAYVNKTLSPTTITINQREDGEIPRSHQFYLLIERQAYFGNENL